MRVNRLGFILALVVLGIWTCHDVRLATADGNDIDRRVRRILEQFPLIDGHNDLPWQIREKATGSLADLDIGRDTAASDTLHTDLLRLREGGVGGQFWSVYVPVELPGPEAVVAVIEQIDLVHRMIERYPGTLELATNGKEIRSIHKRGRVASLIGVEGGHCINNSLSVLRQLYKLGARYMTLTHSSNTDWADACSDEPMHDGLSPFGEQVVREMNRLGMLVDLSHVSPATMEDVLNVTEAPVIFSHSSAHTPTDHVRNVPDDILRDLRDNGGVVMVTFVAPFVSQEVFEYYTEEAAEKARLNVRFPGHKTKIEELLEEWRRRNLRPRATLAQVADHIKHVVELAGIEHVGLGSDFDGMRFPPEGLEDVSAFPNLLEELLRRGYSEGDVKKIAGLNVLRVMREVEKVAGRLRKEQGPSELRFVAEEPGP